MGVKVTTGFPRNPLTKMRELFRLEGQAKNVFGFLAEQDGEITLGELEKQARQIEKAQLN